AIVVVLSSYVTETQKLLEMCGVTMKLDIVGIPDQDYMGTADTLRYIKDRIKRDVLVVSCDLVMEVSLHHVANIFRTYDATVTMLLCSPSDQPADVAIPGPKFKKQSERDFIGFTQGSNRVLFMTSEADLADMNDDKIKFKKSLFRKHPNMNVRSNLTDCHLYVMKKWVINYLAENRQISSIKGELIPHLVRKQFSKQRKAEIPNADESVISEKDKSDIFSHIPVSSMTDILDKTTWIDHTGDMEDCFHGDHIRCYAHIVTGGLCVRTNTVASYCETNKQIHRYLSSLQKDAQNIEPTAVLKGKPQIGSDCLVGNSSTIAEKVSIKRSVIGQHCVIGEKVKISNSVLQDHVRIADGCNIQGCIISSDALMICCMYCTGAISRVASSAVMP
ncbi:hypothetical protein DPMN_048616, partial [Dreissena polymorpha]